MSVDDFKKICDEHMFWCYGTSAIFQRRERRLKRVREWITYLGIVAPLMIGSAVAAFGKDWKVAHVEIVPIIVVVASVVGVVQVVLSTWALVARWDEAYSAAQESIRANDALYRRFKLLYDAMPPEFMHAVQQVLEEYSRQEAQDLRQSITEKEKRYAYHEAMRYQGRPCRTCTVVPDGKSRECMTCGNW